MCDAREACLLWVKPGGYGGYGRVCVCVDMESSGTRWRIRVVDSEMYGHALHAMRV